MSYRIGFCPQCGAQIQVQDISGNWSSFKPNYRQAELIFSNGHKARTIICKDCMLNQDIKKIFDAIVADDSQATNREALDYLKTLGEPVEIKEYVMKSRFQKESK